MSKTSKLFSMLVLFTLLLAACGAEETSTTVPGTDVPAITAVATDDMATDVATEAPTMDGTATDEPGVPVTGDVNPARMSNQLDFEVWTQDGQQVGEVEDMILDLDNRSVAYVIVGTGGFLEIGEKEIAVPWDSLELQTSTSVGTGTDTEPATSTPGTGGTGTDPSTATPGTGTDSGSDTGTGIGAGSADQNVFILLIDQETFSNAPEFDASTLPEMGQSAGDWDATIDSYWQGGGTTTTESSTPVPDATAVPPESNATGSPEATALPEATADASGTDTMSGQTLQGVVLASEVLDSTISLSPGQGQGPVQGQDQATAAPDGTSMPDSTPTVTADQAPGQDQGQGVGNINATIEDMIVDTDTGAILYIVVNTTLDDSERWIPVPLGLIQWDAANSAFLLNANPAMLRDAPFFEDGLFPDTTMDGWNSEFDSFWQNGGTGSGAGTDSTATPAP